MAFGPLYSLIISALRPSAQESPKIMYRDFLFYLKNLGYSRSMQSQIKAALQEFLEVYNHRASSEQIQAHYQYLSERPNKRRSGGLSSITISHHLYALRLYFTYLVEKGIRKEHPMSGLHFPKVEYAPREILSPEQIKLLYKTCERSTERAILSIFYGCGLRRIEGERLDIRDVNLKTRLLYVRLGKGGRRRVVPMSEGVRDDFGNYLETDRRERILKCKAPDPSAFLLSHYGKRMTGGTIYNWFKRLLVRTDLPESISLHHLRHSIATHLLHKGMAIEDVRDFLGHKHLESTQIYTRINHEEI